MTVAQLVWFLAVGWWAALLWLLAALVLCWNPIGWVLAYQVPDVASGEIIGLGD